MDNRYLTELVPAILQAGDAYGETNVGQGQKCKSSLFQQTRQVVYI